MQVHDSLFNPEAFKSTRMPIKQASPLPGSCYTSHEWYQREVDRIFMKEWLCVGREEKVPSIGDFFTVEIVGEPMVVVRDRRKDVRAYSAVCRHRAALVAEGEGNVKAFQCPYHNWTYSLEGELVGTPGRPRPMDDVENFDVKQYGLHQIRLDRWAGFLFITFNPEAPPLRTWLGDLPDRVKNYKLEELRGTRHIIKELAANWKVSQENDIESYHNEAVHGKYLDPLHPQTWALEQSGGPYEVLHGIRSLSTLNTSSFTELEGLTEKERGAGFWYWIHPNMAMNLTPHYMVYRLHFPKGPHKTVSVTTFCFPASAVLDGDPGVKNPQFYQMRDAVMAEDFVIIENVQRGLVSRLYTPGRYSPREEGDHRVANYVLDRVLTD